MKNNIIVSVESRKGGVGKTTAALCIGKRLLEKGYAVLLIDTDITGTNISDCMDSPFWNNCINVLKVFRKKEMLNANLLNLFENDFMNGKRIPSFQNKNNDSGFYIVLNQINVIGSQIYSLDGKPTTICKPSILFDQLHGYWFVDFLKELVEDFAREIKSNPVAIVLDNSPGYVGIAPAVQKWLTDIGPETGKFLLVSSLDKQDMQSCAIAFSALHENYREKWDTSRMFLKAKNGNGENLNYSLMKGDFFIQLTEYDESLQNRISMFPEPFAYYYNSKQDEKYSQDPGKYIGVILNRVPKSVFKHRRTYQPDLPKNNYQFFDLLGGHYSRKWSKFMVGYDPYIEYQFLQSGMSKRRYRGKWSRNLDRLLMKKNEIFYNKEFLYMAEEISPNSFSRINDYIRQVQNIIDTAIDAIRTNGLDYLADLIDDDWQPKSIIANLQATFYNFMVSADYPYFKEIYWEEFENENIKENERLYRFENLFNKLDLSFENLNEYPEIKNAIFYLIACLPLPYKREIPFEKELLNFLRSLIKIDTFVKSPKNIIFPISDSMISMCYSDENFKIRLFTNESKLN